MSSGRSTRCCWSSLADARRSADAPQPVYHKVDLRDEAAIEKVFSEHQIWAVIHLAALKAVGESGEVPLAYYRINVGGSVSLLEVCHPPSCW